MNHRSNMDYVLVSFLAAERVALSYAVGEWARIWPLQGLIRAMGAYFVRRNSGDPLYRMVLQRYVQMATEGGVPQAMYPEGGLTTDGAPARAQARPARLHAEGVRPAGSARPRLHSGRHQLRPRPRGPLAAAQARPGGGARRPGAQARDAGAIRGAPVDLAVLGRRYRHGYACVNFGTPVSMRAYVAEHGVDFRVLDDAERREPVAAVGRMLMARIGEVVPVLPVPLVATVLLRDDARALAELELKASVHALMDGVEAAGGHVYVPRTDRDYALTVGLRMLTLRGLVQENEGLFRRQPERAADPALLRQLDRPPGRVAPPRDQKKRGPKAPFRFQRSAQLFPAAGEAEEREQRLEHVVEVEVDAQRGADVVGFLAVADSLQVVQDERREDSDHQHRDRDE